MFIKGLLLVALTLITIRLGIALLSKESTSLVKLAGWVCIVIAITVFIRLTFQI